jgi:hypothetical protein
MTYKKTTTKKLKEKVKEITRKIAKITSLKRTRTNKTDNKTGALLPQLCMPFQKADHYSTSHRT